ncbi:hypothetical protein LTS10_005142 [Elasticomyces elasticus]|nr:hypothetical protein LTS10_005142 [Elasticomyces elasticus]
MTKKRRDPLELVRDVVVMATSASRLRAPSTLLDSDGGQSAGRCGGPETLKDLSVILRQLCEGQAALTHNISELVIAQKATTRSIDKLVQVQEAAIAVQNPTAPRPVLDAGSRLTNTFELLEQVLLNVDMETAFFAQRVNRSFNSTIQNSRLLQQKLYFLPAEDDGLPVLNPLLVKKSVMDKLPLWRLSSGRLAYCDGYRRVAVSVEQPQMVKSYDPVPSFLVAWRMSAIYEYLSQGEERIALGPGSWRRMYLTQRTCMTHCTVTKIVKMVGTTKADMNNTSEVGNFRIDANRTMDKILEALAEVRLDLQDVQY